MRFEIFQPSEILRPYIKQFAISEIEYESEYKVFPSLGIVIGFQYKGNLAIIQDSDISTLQSAGITGIVDSYKVFKNSPGIGTFLVFFTEIGLAHFTNHPVNELFNLSIGLDYIFEKSLVYEVQERLVLAQTDEQKIQVVERFFLSQLKSISTDKLIVEAVRMIYQSHGSIRVKELNEKLHISLSPFEKRFRKLVGTSPKKFASIVRFNVALSSLENNKSLLEICYENNFFDQAHFIKDFKQFTGVTPDKLKKSI